MYLSLITLIPGLIAATLYGFWWSIVIIPPAFFFLLPNNNIFRLDSAGWIAINRGVFYLASVTYIIVACWVFQKHIGSWYGWAIGCVSAWAGIGSIASDLEEYLFFRNPKKSLADVDRELEAMANKFIKDMKD